MEDWTSYILPGILAVPTAVVLVLIVLALRPARGGQAPDIGTSEAGGSDDTEAGERAP